MKFLAGIFTILLFSFSVHAQKSASNQSVIDSSKFATVWFYRPFIPKFNAPLKEMPVYVNDTLVRKFKANKGFAMRLYKEAKYRFAVDKNGETEIPLNVKFGEEYYFRCEIKKGLWFGKPAFESVNKKTGKEEIGAAAGAPAGQ